MCIRIEKITDTLSRIKVVYHCYYQFKNGNEKIIQVDFPSKFLENSIVKKLFNNGFISIKSEYPDNDKWIYFKNSSEPILLENIFIDCEINMDEAVEKKSIELE